MSASARPVSGRDIRLKTLGILVGIAVGVAAAAFVQQYRLMMRHAGLELTELVHSQARVFEAVARYDAIHAQPGDNPRATTLSQLREAQYAARGFGLAL